MTSRFVDRLIAPYGGQVMSLRARVAIGVGCIVVVNVTADVLFFRHQVLARLLFNVTTVLVVAGVYFARSKR